MDLPVFLVVFAAGATAALVVALYKKKISNGLVIRIRRIGIPFAMLPDASSSYGC